MIRYPRIELVYDPDCPNVERARQAIREALSVVGAPLAWREYRREDVETPMELRALGSPSVLVNGVDVGCKDGSDARPDANSCRVYIDDCGCLCGAPSRDLIVHAIAATAARSESA